MNKLTSAFLAVFLLVVGQTILAQSTPVGLPGMDDYLRRQQLLGDTTRPASLMIRPSLSTTDSLKGFELKMMPLVWKQQYTTDHPLSLNNGAMIPARGYQTLVSGGFFARLGILSVQLMPEFVYAENKDFDGFPDAHPFVIWRTYNMLKGVIDLPDKFGNDPYKRAFWGQSSVRLSYKAVSLGLSNENLWWGPGQKNALMMTNNAPGFKHVTFNSTKPVKTPIGSFEWQLVGGRLDASGFHGVDSLILATKTLKPTVKPNGWRYLNAITVNYQPRWLNGLSLGGARAYTMYSELMNKEKIKSWLPVFESFTKDKAGEASDDNTAVDQILSVWMRWLMPKDHAEVYIEYGRGDHNWHLNDFLLEPDHFRSYILGYRKLVPLKKSNGDYLDIHLELTQLSRNVPTYLRSHSGLVGWYNHGAVRHGYTHQGQILGAGIGTSSNMQLLNIAWVRDKKRIGLEFYRLIHDDDFWNAMRRVGYFDHRTHWVDISGALVADWNYKNFLVNFKFQTVGALNYMFYYDPVPTEPPYLWDVGKTRYNINIELSLVYQFNKLND
ncbi:MAG: capsule assembly Wzi family protein [Paludibacter sp.]|nr:capsule assembly Wzi family protein [Paludibacter sp.]